MKTKTSTKQEYIRRINKVIEYINNHLTKDMDLKKLAGVSNFSEFHFHRIFKAFQHETVSAYITRIRVETAARLLRYSDLPIETIAGNVGYEMPSSLSKSFKKFYGITPTEYRTNKNIFIMKKEVVNTELKLKAPKILELEDKTAIYIRLTGAYNDLDFPGTFAKLWSFVKEQKLYSAGIEHVGVYYDDPKVTESSKLRSDVCLVIKKPVQPKGEIDVKVIPGGKYAVFSYQGPYSNLGMVYDTIFSEWLPASGCELRDLPVFEKYGNNPTQTEPEKLKTEIYVPIQ
ncbi:AraC family transcriptional regulator [Prolixibacter bellariivorans]|uniref:AraC family transcriptional regulator n=1 Tax=Prolixibacter bellariivorans TaxID=314319 RepID=A0A5M4AUG2_9BACT|nr:AraC family transcriptional regulator [Prolixibacter bellariivorans]GET31599.1 AraC family transcriptional regulator [Prolixibacter bellariivorans]